jgi:Holliday junction resolvasome RuvABC ATP-dependent DNA helicase subunit
LKEGLVIRTAAGRKVTERAFEHLELERPRDSADPQQRLL